MPPMRKAALLTMLMGAALHSTAQWVPGTEIGTLHGVIGTTTGYLGISNVLYQSDDAGSNWTSWTPTIGGVPIIAIMRDAHYRSASEVYMAGGVDLDNQYGILRSTDGGTTWQAVYSLSTGSWPRRFNDMDFPSANIGYAVGSNGRMVKTTNGGGTWTNLTVFQTQEVRNVLFFDDNTGLIAGSGQVWRTVNGGSSWTNLLTLSGDAWMARNAAGLVGVATSGAIHLSSDQGISWTPLSSPAQNPVGIAVIDEQRIMVIEGDVAYFTTTGGSFWEMAAIPEDQALRDVHFLDPDHGCLVGGQPSGHGLLLVTNNGFGNGYPVVALSPATSTQECGSTLLELSVAPVAPGWSVQWTLNGQPIGNDASISITFTENTTAQLEALVSNGINTTTLTSWNTVTVLQPFTVEAGSDVLLCSGNSAALSATGPPGSTYLWSPATGLSQANVANPTVSNLTGTVTYTVTVTNGPCTAIDQVTVEQLPAPPADDWVEILNVPFSSSQSYDFADAYNGFFSTSGTLHRTFDGGDTWVTQASPMTWNVSADIRMVDPFFGFMAGGYDLRMTTDGWATNTDLNQAFSAVFSNNTHKFIHYKNRDTLLVVKNDADGWGVVFAMSYTGGLHWQNVSQEFPNQVRDVLFVNDSTILAVGGNGLSTSLLIRSDDHGHTWTYGPFPGAGGVVTSLAKQPDGTLYAIAKSAPLLISTDNGITWQPSTAPNMTAVSGSDAVDMVWTDEQTAFMSRTFFYKTLNGGACWHQVAAPGNITYPTRGVHQGGSSFFTNHTSGGGGRRIFRLGQPVPGLHFTLASDTICLGGVQQAVNNSTGFDSFEWLLDGQVVSTAAQPVLPEVGAGDHTITLIGYQGDTPTQQSKSFHVQDFQLVPEIFMMEEPCWQSVEIPLGATASNNVLGFHWYVVSNLGTPISLGGRHTIDDTDLAGTHGLLRKGHQPFRLLWPAQRQPGGGGHGRDPQRVQSCRSNFSMPLRAGGKHLLHRTGPAQFAGCGGLPLEPFPS